MHKSYAHVQGPMNVQSRSSLRRVIRRMSHPLVMAVSAALALSASSLFGQSNEGDYSVTYGWNYSSVDRKQTIDPSNLIPGSFAYRPICSILLAVDDDSFVSNKAATSYENGTGNLGLEAHWTFWRGFRDINGDCAASKRSSLRLDYIASVPVHNTLESTELGHQIKVTYARPTSTAAGLVSILTVNAGANVSGLATGGNTVNALATGNYYRNFHAGGAWAFEGEADLSSHSRLGPSSAAVLIAFDGSLGRAQVWGIRFGSTFGITPYAPKFSPFVQINFSGSFKPKE
jgi:hypothetical protein